MSAPFSTKYFTISKSPPPSIALTKTVRPPTDSALTLAPFSTNSFTFSRSLSYIIESNPSFNSGLSIKVFSTIFTGSISSISSVLVSLFLQAIMLNNNNNSTIFFIMTLRFIQI